VAKYSLKYTISQQANFASIPHYNFV